MEHLADQAVRGVDPDMIHTAIRRYIAHCPDCNEHHKQRLAELEAEIALWIKES
jgi:Fe-S-cluster formation regulator IscX/YfhJ